MSVYQYSDAKNSSSSFQAINANNIVFQDVLPTDVFQKMYATKGTLYFNGYPISNFSKVVSTAYFIEGVTLEEINTLGFTGLVSAGKDEASKLNAFLQGLDGELAKFGIVDGVKFKVIVESKKGYCFFNGQIKVPSNCTLSFLSTVICGNDFTVRSEGSFREIPSAIGNAPIITQFTDGNTLTVNRNNQDMTTWAVGSLIAIRDTSENNRYDAIIASITNLGNNLFRITTVESIDAPLTNGDTVRLYDQSRITQPITRGACRIHLSNIATIPQGRFIVIRSKNKVGDFQAHNFTRFPDNVKMSYSDNLYKYQVCKVVQKSNSQGYIVVDIPVSHDYTVDECHILELNPSENIVIEGLRVVSLQQGTQPRENNHIVYLNRCCDAVIRDISFTDMDSLIDAVKFPYVDNIVQIRSCYGVKAINCNITRWNKEDSGSGASYGITMYYSTNCAISDCTLSSLRHNILFQGACWCKVQNCQLDNPLISALDLHGIGSRDNVFDSIEISCSRDQTSLNADNATEGNSTIACVRVGNSFHPVGDSYNTFRNITITNALPTGDVTDVWGIEVVPASSYNHFENIRIHNCDTGIAGFDHPVHRFGNSNQMLSTNNTFKNITIEDCNENVQINGSRNQKARHAYQEPTNTSNDPFVSSVIISAGLAVVTVENEQALFWYNYPDYYDNKFILFGNGNVSTPAFAQIQNFNLNPTNVQFILNTTFNNLANAPPPNTKITIYDSPTVSINPIRDWYFLNCSFLRNKKTVCCDNRYSSNIRYIDNYFLNNHTENTVSTTNFAQTFHHVGNFTNVHNLYENCKRGIWLSNASMGDVLQNTSLDLTNGFSSFLRLDGTNTDIRQIDNAVYPT